MKSEMNPQEKTPRPKDPPKPRPKPTEEFGSRPRLSYTASFNNLVVGGTQYHPEKVNVSFTKTIDFIEGETEEQTRERINDLDFIQSVLIESVDKSLGDKVKAIKNMISKKMAG